MGIVRLGPDAFRVRWLDGGKPPLGMYRQETLRGVTRDDAVRYWKKKVADAAQRRPGEGPSRATFADLVKRYLEVRGPKLAPDWRKNVAGDPEAEKVGGILGRLFLPRFGARRAEELRAADVIRYRHDREGDVSGATINREVAVLMSVLNFAEAEGWIERNPIARGKVKPYREQRRSRAFTPEEWHRLVTAFDAPETWAAHVASIRRLGPVVTDLETGEARRHGGGPRPGSAASEEYRERLRAATTVFRALLLFGCRRGEILDLRWNDVDARRGVVRVRLPKTARRGMPQKVLPLVAGLKDLVESQPRGVGEAHVFQRPDGGPWEEGKVARAFRLAKAMAGLQEPEGTPRAAVLVLHSIRHTAETWLARGGFTETLRNAYLGHTDGSMAATYTHLEPADLVPLAELLTRESQKSASGDAKGDAQTKRPGRARP